MIIEEKEYQKLLKAKKDYKRILLNGLEAFLFGGLICLLGQFILYILAKFVDDNALKTSIMVIIIISFSGILTALGLKGATDGTKGDVVVGTTPPTVGLYDKIGQMAKAGSILPISGFENSLCSAAMEFKSEGFLLGLGANILKLAGSVLVFGIISGYMVGLIKYLVSLWS